ncbi:DUF3102 domain-containing protein [Bradyrhizobium sp. CSS354]|nr:DUF3102 domain-containing protein [Bradyrhizobium sp. CSS354]
MFVSSEHQNVLLFPEQKVERDLSTEDLLQELAEEIRDRSRSTTAAVIAIGVALARGKDRIRHGEFAKWVAEQCGFTARTAQNYMLAAALAAKYEIVSLLTPAALYRLAAPKTPEALLMPWFACSAMVTCRPSLRLSNSSKLKRLSATSRVQAFHPRTTKKHANLRSRCTPSSGKTSRLPWSTAIGRRFATICAKRWLMALADPHFWHWSITNEP